MVKPSGKDVHVHVHVHVHVQYVAATIDTQTLEFHRLV